MHLVGIDDNPPRCPLRCMGMGVHGYIESEGPPRISSLFLGPALASPLVTKDLAQLSSVLVGIWSKADQHYHEDQQYNTRPIEVGIHGSSSHSSTYIPAVVPVTVMVK